MNYTYSAKNSEAGGTLVFEEISGAGNTNIDLSPGSVRWNFVLGRVQLEAVGVATRTIRLRVYDESDNFLVEYPSSPDITNGQTRSLNLTTNVTIPTSAGVWDWHEGIGELVLEGGMYLRISAANGLAADTISGYILFREFGI
jgi:hypothetical protein